MGIIISFPCHTFIIVIRNLLSSICIPYLLHYIAIYLLPTSVHSIIILHVLYKGQQSSSCTKKNRCSIFIFVFYIIYTHQCSVLFFYMIQVVVYLRVLLLTQHVFWCFVGHIQIKAENSGLILEYVVELLNVFIWVFQQNSTKLL